MSKPILKNHPRVIKDSTAEAEELVHSAEDNESSQFMPFVSAFSLPKHEGILYTLGHPRPYRADCKVGQFKVGESLKGSKLKLEIVSYRMFYAELFNYPYQCWLEVFFVDPDNTLSHILFKGMSIESFVNLYTEMLIRGRAIGEGTVTARMEKRAGKEGDYYVVIFEWEENKKERVQELLDFLTTQSLNSMVIPNLPRTKNEDVQNDS